MAVAPSDAAGRPQQALADGWLSEVEAGRQDAMELSGFGRAASGLGAEAAAASVEGGLARAAWPLLAVEGAPPSPRSADEPSLSSLWTPASMQTEQSTASGRRTSLRHRIPTVAHGHRIPVTQYLTLGAWFVMLFVQYGCVRFVCKFHIPEDCKPKNDVVLLMEDMQYLLFPGFVLAVMTGMNWPDRFLYIFSFSRAEPRGWWFLSVYFVFAFVWSCLHLIPVLGDFTLTEWRPEWCLPLFLVGGGSLYALGWHFWAAYKYNSRSGFVAYILSRLALLTFFSLYILIKVENETDIVFHFHHYAFGLVVASLAEFNHPVSLLLLACGTAVFVQGLAAYGAETIIRYPMKQIIVIGAHGEHLRSPLVTEEAADWFRSVCTFQNNLYVMNTSALIN